MIINVKVNKVDYETDGFEVNLPSEFDFKVEAKSVEELYDIICDEISDETGLLVKSFDYDIISISCLDGIERTMQEYDEWLYNKEELLLWQSFMEQ